MDVNNNEKISIDEDIKQLKSGFSICRKEIRRLGEILFKRWKLFWLKTLRRLENKINILLK